MEPLQPAQGLHRGPCGELAQRQPSTISAPLPGVHFPQLLAHPIIPHRDQAFLASADDFPVIHLHCRDSQLVSRERQGDFVSAEVVDPHPGRPKMSTEKGIGMRVKA